LEDAWNLERERVSAVPKDMRQELNRRVIVAADCGNRQEALALAGTLAGSGCWLKIGLELFTACGPSILNEIKEFGFSVFLDLKLHDIPNTVERTVKVLARQGAELISVHCSGGYEMMARAAAAARAVRAAGSSQAGASGRDAQVIGVTVLTSLTEAGLQAELGVQRRLEEHVVHLARLAQQAGLDGVVASAREAALLRAVCGPQFVLVTPGIRAGAVAGDDQARTCSPREALAAGSSYLVIGRPITAAADPRAALTGLWD